MPRRLFALITAALTITLSLPIAPAQATPPAPAANYLAVGDSITAGLGVSVDRAYPSLLDAGSRHLRLAADAAVSGATVAGVASQLLAYPAADRPGITRITLTVGANDVGWLAALSACLNLPADTACATQIADPVHHLTLANLVDAGLATLATTLPRLLVQIKALYPNAKIFVAGYYELFGSKRTACTVAPGYSINLVNKTWYNQISRQLNRTIKTSVAAANHDLPGTPAKYVDVSGAFDGHGFCDSGRRWVIGPQDDLTAVAHPNVKGQRAYAGAFRAKGIS